MTDSTVNMAEKIRAFITEYILDGERSVADDEELLLSNLLDSLAIAQLVVFIEEELSITIPPEDLRIENFQTIAKIDVYLNQ